GPFGNLAQVTDPGEHVTTITSDPVGRPQQVVDPDRGTTTFTYNAFGEVVRTLDANGTNVTFAYDVAGRKVRRDDPEGSTSWAWDTAVNGIGKLASTASPHGVTKSYEYDNRSRLSASQTYEPWLGVQHRMGYRYDAYSRLQYLDYPGWSLGFSV